MLASAKLIATGLAKISIFVQNIKKMMFYSILNTLKCFKYTVVSPFFSAYIPFNLFNYYVIHLNIKEFIFILFLLVLILQISRLYLTYYYNYFMEVYNVLLSILMFFLVLISLIQGMDLIGLLVSIGLLPVIHCDSTDTEDESSDEGNLSENGSEKSVPIVASILTETEDESSDGGNLSESGSEKGVPKGIPLKRATYTDRSEDLSSQSIRKMEPFGADKRGSNSPIYGYNDGTDSEINLPSEKTLEKISNLAHATTTGATIAGTIGAMPSGPQGATLGAALGALSSFVTEIIHQGINFHNEKVISKSDSDNACTRDDEHDLGPSSIVKSPSKDGFYINSPSEDTFSLKLVKFLSNFVNLDKTENI